MKIFKDIITTLMGIALALLAVYNLWQNSATLHEYNASQIIMVVVMFIISIGLILSPDELFHRFFEILKENLKSLVDKHKSNESNPPKP